MIEPWNRLTSPLFFQPCLHVHWAKSEQSYHLAPERKKIFPFRFLSLAAEQILPVTPGHKGADFAYLIYQIGNASSISMMLSSNSSHSTISMLCRCMASAAGSPSRTALRDREIVGTAWRSTRAITWDEAGQRHRRNRDDPTRRTGHDAVSPTTRGLPIGRRTTSICSHVCESRLIPARKQVFVKWDFTATLRTG